MESKQRLLEPQLVQTGRADQFSRKVFCDGMRDGVPIALGYFAVSFSLGIAARKAGFTPFQGFLVSLLNNASAGEYAAFALIMANATYFEVAVITLIANARYLLMSCALAQRFAPETPFWHRLLIGYDVTDELFGITIARPGNLNPYYTYGAILLAAPAWACGTALGIIAGNLLPLRVVSALSVALYGMFLAIIIPPARKDRIVAVLVVISFALSVVMSYISNEALASAGTILSFAVLLLFIALGIVFDMIGVASTSATEKEFHSMAAHRVRGAREAVWMVRNAEKVSSICNDVVGDICGIISGATGALIVAHITSGVSAGLKVAVSLLITGLVSALTIGGKAIGKKIAMKKSKDVIYLTAKVLSVLHLGR